MEPERQIEKLLRAFAKKRRAEGSDAFKLQPWVRRNLQDAVAQEFAGAAETSLSLPLWQLCRRKWAMLAGFALLILLGASLLVPALSNAKHQAKTVTAMNQLKQIGAAAQMAAAENHGRLPATLGALTNGFINRDTLTDPASGKPFVYVAGGEVLDALPTNAVLAYSPELKKTRAVLFADGSVREFSEKKFAAASRSGFARPSSTMKLAANRAAPAGTAAPASIPALAKNEVLSGPGGAGGKLAAARAPVNSIAGKTSGTAGGGLAAANLPAAAPAAQATRQLFDNQAVVSFAAPAEYFQTTNRFQLLERTKSAAAGRSSVLAKFEVRRNGNAISIVDHDGSIYRGLVTPEVATNKAAAKPAMAGPAGQSLQFSVSGENQSLKQRVVFIGDIFSMSQPSATNGAVRQLSLRQARITGTVTVGKTNQMRIDVVSMAP